MSSTVSVCGKESLCRKKEICRMTIDHSVVEQLIRSGSITHLSPVFHHQPILPLPQNGNWGAVWHHSQHRRGSTGADAQVHPPLAHLDPAWAFRFLQSLPSVTVVLGIWMMAASYPAVSIDETGSRSGVSMILHSCQFLCVSV